VNPKTFLWFIRGEVTYVGQKTLMNGSDEEVFKRAAEADEQRVVVRVDDRQPPRTIRVDPDGVLRY